jgi:hypothetical protein
LKNFNKFTIFSQNLANPAKLYPEAQLSKGAAELPLTHYPVAEHHPKH